MQFLKNTYNHNKIKVSEKVFQMLAIADGFKTIETLMERQKINDEAEKAAVLKEILDLWFLRTIKLEPGKKILEKR